MNTRQQDILLLTEKHGEITIKDLARLLDVSEMTIHRDLDQLQDIHLISKKRGAAVFVEAPHALNSEFYAEEKRSIGKKAAALLRPGDSVIFDNSTTALECAKHLDDSLHLTCYTTNLEISQVIAKSGKHILYCSGGYYFPDSTGFIGPHAENFVDRVRADVAIVGASGISIEHGITNPYPMHNVLQSKIIHAAKRCILLADHSKFDRVAMEKNAELSEISAIITDQGIRKDVLEKYRQHVEIILA